MLAIPRWLPVVLCATTLAMVAGCGEDDQPGGDDPASAATDRDSTDGTSPSPNEGPVAAPDPSASDEDQINAVITNIDQAFKTDDGQLICANLAKAGKRDLAYYGEVLNIPGGCVKIATTMAKQSLDDGPPPRVLKVQVNGDKAAALLRVDAGSIRQRYDKVNGTWKVHSFRVGEAAGGQPAP